jgi:hypothetical protein
MAINVVRLSRSFCRCLTSSVARSELLPQADRFTVLSSAGLVNSRITILSMSRSLFCIFLIVATRASEIGFVLFPMP